MEHYRRTAHTRFDLKYHFVWITKYRKKLLRVDVAVRLRQLVRDICAELEVEIVKGHVSKDHVHLFVSCPPHVSPSYLMQRIKGEIVAEAVAAVQPPEQGMLGPTSVGSGILCG
jgi:putative transposase